jgi:hypothetical protein
MPARKLTKARKALIAHLESIIGNECYNANIQNWGPGGTFEGEGREFRYPVTFRDADGNKIKRHHADAALADALFFGGYYAFGANELHIMRGLNRILEYLEQQHGLEIG